MTTKLLLFPWGNNNGHVVRCGALGSAAMRQGMSVVIPVLTESQEQIVRAMGCAPVMYPSGSVPREFWSIWGDVDFVRHAVALDIDMINEHRPDLVVHDGRMSANVACSVSSVPSVGVMQHIHFPGHQYEGRDTEALWSAGIDGFTRAAASFGVTLDLADLREVFTGSPVLVPSIPEIDPVPGAWRHRTEYIGPLTGYSANGVDFSDQIPPDAVFFYRTVDCKTSLSEFADAFGDMRRRIYIATGDSGSAEELSSRPEMEGFNVAPLWRLGASHSESSIAVIHGGHGTTLTMLQAGMPSVYLADASPERFSNAEKAARIGGGILLRSSSDTGWDWSMHGTPASSVRWNQVREACDELLRDRAAFESARIWAAALSAHYSPALALTSALSRASVPSW